MFIKKADLEMLQSSVLAACSRCGNDMCNGCEIVKSKELIERMLGSEDQTPPTSDEYYNYVLRGSHPALAKIDPEKEIMYVILQDLCDRRGLRQAFESCDPNIQEEIMATWLEIIRTGGQE